MTEDNVILLINAVLAYGVISFCIGLYIGIGSTITPMKKDHDTKRESD